MISRSLKAYASHPRFKLPIIIYLIIINNTHLTRKCGQINNNNKKKNTQIRWGYFTWKPLTKSWKINLVK